MIDLGRTCARHRPLLVDFVDHGEIRPGTEAALRHLDTCTRCTDEIAATMLTITALRRLGDEVARAEPRADAWPRLRARLTGWRFERVTSAFPLARVVLTVGLAAVLVVPVRLTAIDSRDSTTAPAAGSAPTSSLASTPAATVAALSYSAPRRIVDASDPGLALPETASKPKLNRPDGNGPVEKEVPSAPTPGPRSPTR